MASFYFPLLWWIPELNDDQLSVGRYTLHRRKWEVSIFDLYTIVSQKPSVSFPAEVANVFLGNVNCEVCVDGYEKVGDAQIAIDVLRAMLYIDGHCPTVVPFSTNYSLNAYAGINERSSSHGRERLNEGLREGITTSESRVEMQGYELSFSCIRGVGPYATRMTAESFAAACENAEKWRKIEKVNHLARATRTAFVKAPLVPDLGSSLLQIWQGIESMFPTVSSEVTFRISLLLSQHVSGLVNRIETYKDSRRSYADRSNIAHGNGKSVNTDAWQRAWKLLCLAVKAIVEKGAMPSEDALIDELLNNSRL